MLPPAWLRRPFATLIGVWFALNGAVAPAAVPCPMPHAATRSSGYEAAPFVAHDRDAHAAHASSGVPAEEPAPADAPLPFHQCDCSTNCCGAPNTTLPDVRVLVLTVTTGPAAVAHSSPLVRAASRTRLLPFAQAPPA